MSVSIKCPAKELIAQTHKQHKRGTDQGKNTFKQFFYEQPLKDTGWHFSFNFFVHISFKLSFASPWPLPRCLSTPIVGEKRHIKYISIHKTAHRILPVRIIHTCILDLYFNERRYLKRSLSNLPVGIDKEKGEYHITKANSFLSISKYRVVEYPFSITMDLNSSQTLSVHVRSDSAGETASMNKHIWTRNWYDMWYIHNAPPTKEALNIDIMCEAITMYAAVTIKRKN